MSSQRNGFVAFYALTVLLILTFVAFGVEFANISRGATIHYSFVDSQARQALDAGMAIALRVASTTTEFISSYTFSFETGPHAWFTVNIETGTGSVSIATVSATLFDYSGHECARRRGRVKIATDLPLGNRFIGGWKRF